MIRINLLPHRELKRKARQQQVAISVGVVFAVGLLIIWAGYDVIAGKIDTQNGRNQFLNSHITILDQQIAEIRDIKNQTQELLSRKDVV
ncbi:MAG: fimbrial protein, partial [Nitrosomonas sp.]|nr:fimbrial protein [Nitrosomonas sp.]